MSAIQLLRHTFLPDRTLGTLLWGKKRISHTLELPVRPVKVKGHTAIGVGRYPIQLRQTGKMNLAYLDRFGPWHRGMLHLQNVPHFNYIYLHIGNLPKHTKGCILLGEKKDDSLINSTKTYGLFYEWCLEVLDRKEALDIEVVNQLGDQILEV